MMLIYLDFFCHKQPVDLLPFRLEDARRELEVNGDFTIEALNVLRNAEGNRRGKSPIYLHI